MSTYREPTHRIKIGDRIVSKWGRGTIYAIDKSDGYIRINFRRSDGTKTAVVAEPGAYVRLERP